MKDLYYIRHGLSEANKAGTWAGGIFDSPLAPEGIEQAKAAGAKAAKDGLKFDLIVSSPLSRAYETAKQVALATSYPIDKIMLSDEVVERKFGDLEGKANTELMDEYSKDETFIDSMNGVETLAAFQARADEFLKSVKAMPEPCILIASHGAFGRALNRSLAGKTYIPNGTNFTQIPNAEIIKLI